MFPGVPASSDCCEETVKCLGVSGDGSCCTSDSPCARGHGDCDSDSDCDAGLVCGKDNCQDFTAEALSSYDCCI